MTGSIYNDNSALPNLIASAVQEVVRQAKALGISWTIRPATVSLSTTGTTSVVLDGDTNPISVTNMSGIPLISGQRVYVLITPPSGNFVFGFTGSRAPTALRARSGNFALLGSVSTLITFTAVDEAEGFSAAAGDTSFTIPTTGWYSITVPFTMSTPATANSVQYVTLDITSSVPNWTSLGHRAYWSINNLEATLGITQLFNEGDSFLVRVFQNSFVSDISAVGIQAIMVSAA